jgi:hypothetical protein
MGWGNTILMSPGTQMRIRGLKNYAPELVPNFTELRIREMIPLCVEMAPWSLFHGRCVW